MTVGQILGLSIIENYVYVYIHDGCGIRKSVCGYADSPVFSKYLDKEVQSFTWNAEDMLVFENLHISLK